MVTLLSGSVPGLNTLQLGYRAKVREKGGDGVVESSAPACQSRIGKGKGVGQAVGG